MGKCDFILVFGNKYRNCVGLTILCLVLIMCTVAKVAQALLHLLCFTLSLRVCRPSYVACYVVVLRYMHCQTLHIIMYVYTCVHMKVHCGLVNVIPIQPYVLELQPPALLLPAPIPLATDIRHRVKVIS